MPLGGVGPQVIVMTELRGRKLQHVVREASGEGPDKKKDMPRGLFTGGKQCDYTFVLGSNLQNH